MSSKLIKNIAIGIMALYGLKLFGIIKLEK